MYAQACFSLQSLHNNFFTTQMVEAIQVEQLMSQMKQLEVLKCVLFQNEMLDVQKHHHQIPQKFLIVVLKVLAQFGPYCPPVSILLKKQEKFQWGIQGFLVL